MDRPSLPVCYQFRTVEDKILIENNINYFNFICQLSNMPISYATLAAVPKRKIDTTKPRKTSVPMFQLPEGFKLN